MSRIQAFRSEPALRRPALAVVLLSVTSVLGDVLLTAVFDSVSEGTSPFPVWLPQLGTIGETVLYYSLLLEFLQFIVLPMALLWLGYAYGRYTASKSPA